MGSFFKRKNGEDTSAEKAKEAAKEELSPDETEKRIREILSGEDKNTVKSKRKPKKIKKIIIIAVIAVILLLFLSRLMGKKEMSLPPVSELKKGEIESSLTVTGPVEGTESVDVTSNLHAKVTELNVKEGDEVKEGETVLLKIDTADIEKEIENAKGNLELLRAQREEKLRDEQAQYEKALQDLAFAEDDFNRKNALYQTGDISKVDYDTALNALNDARRTAQGFNVENGRVTGDESSDLEIENAERALRQVEDKLEDAVIKAPISGTVTRVYTKVGQFADKTDDANNPLIVIEDLKKLQMKVKISEYSIGMVKEDQPVEITADILGGKTVEGKIASISPTGEEKGGGSTERVIPAIVSIEDDSGLIAGITAKAKILLAKAEDSFTVPISAVSDDGEGDKLIQFVISEGTEKNVGSIESVKVETGIEGDINIEIKDTVSKEDRELLKEGAIFITSYDASLEGMSGSFASPEKPQEETAAVPRKE